MTPYVIDGPRRRVVLTIPGVMTAAGITETATQISQDPAFGPDFAVLFDLRELTGLRINAAELQELVALCPVVREARRALLVALPVWFSLVNPLGGRLHSLYEALTRYYPHVAVFWRPLAAQRWLDLDLVDLPPAVSE